MLQTNETVVYSVSKEIKSCMAFTPIIYIETDDRILMHQLLNRKDCFSIFRTDENETIQPTSYVEYDETCNVILVDGNTKFHTIHKTISTWGEKPLYFVAKDFHLIDGYTQKKIITNYIKMVFEKQPDIPLKQNLFLVSPLGMRVGEQEGSCVPSGFEQYIHVIDVPLLGVLDIANQVIDVQNKILHRIHAPTLTIETYMNEPDSYIYECKGLNRSHIAYVLYELQNHFGVVSSCGIPCALSKTISDTKLNLFAKQLIQKQKQQMVCKNGDISYIDTTKAVIPAGIDGIQEWIDDKKRILEQPQRAKQYGIRFPKGILVTGLPGSGKSLLAKYIANQLHLTLIQFKMDMVLQGIVGSSEQRMKQVLKLFEASAPCMIWVDEIEKEFAGMQGSGESDSGVGRRCLAKLLNWMQEHKSDCFIYATANKTSDLPQELLRRGRFDRLYYSFLPMECECVNILYNHIAYIQQETPTLFDGSVNETNIKAMGHRIFQQLSTHKRKFFTGSDIEGCIADVKELFFLEDTKYNTIKDLEKKLLDVATYTIPYAESHFDEVVSYWVRLQAQPFHNIAVPQRNTASNPYTKMLFDFSDMQYNGTKWAWRKDLCCGSTHTYDKNMFLQLTDAIQKYMNKT